MGKYRQGRKIFWATLALLLLVVAMPLSVAGVEYWNEHIAGTEAIVYELNNENATISDITNPLVGRIVAYVYDPTGMHDAEQSVFWQANVSWNEFIISTGASSTDNTTSSNSVFFNLNLSAKQLIDENINKIVMKFRGLNNNVNLTYEIHAVENGHGYHDAGYSINLMNIQNIYETGKIETNNTTAITIKLDPAVISYANSHLNNSHINIKIMSTDPAKEAFSEGQTIYFRIYATHPHGRAVVGTYDATEVILAIWTGIGIAVLFVTSPAWNPTTHNGLIEHIIQHRRYSRASRSRSSRSRSRRTHRTHRSSHRRRSTHRRRR